MALRKGQQKCSVTWGDEKKRNVWHRARLPLPTWPNKTHLSTSTPRAFLLRSLGRPLHQLRPVFHTKRSRNKNLMFCENTELPLLYAVPQAVTWETALYWHLLWQKGEGLCGSKSVAFALSIVPSLLFVSCPILGPLSCFWMKCGMCRVLVTVSVLKVFFLFSTRLNLGGVTGLYSSFYRQANPLFYFINSLSELQK